jgi:tripartite-type tricarboxylate transporter receptor subunit TctC
VLAAAGIALAAALATPAFAADPYPARAVRVVVPWPAGPATDVAARAVAERLAASSGQAFVIDNKPGGGGALGSDLVARAAPDGYTLLAGSTGSVTVNPLVSRTSYDAASFVPAGLVATVPYVLVTAPGFPARDAASLLALLRANPGKYSFASSGGGSIGHLISEIFLSKAGVKALHVPYKGSAPAQVDLQAGRVDFMFDSVSAVMPHLRSGRLRAYGLSSARRSASLPDVPPLSVAAGLADFDLYAWIGFVAPAGTPAPVLATLNQQIQQAVASKAVRDQYAILGIEPVDPIAPAELGKLIGEERSRIAALVRSANIKAD